MSDIYFCIYLLVSSNFKGQKKKPRYFETSIASFFSCRINSRSSSLRNFLPGYTITSFIRRSAILSYAVPVHFFGEVLPESVTPTYKFPVYLSEA